MPRIFSPRARPRLWARGTWGRAGPRSSAARQTKPVSDGLFLAWATAGLASVALRRTPNPQFRPNPAFEWMRGSHAKEIAMDMDSAEHCRVQAEECRRQLLGAERSRNLDPDLSLAQLGHDCRSNRPIRRDREK